MLDLEQFEADLVELVLKCGVNEYVHQTGGHVAARIIEFIELMKVCHAEARDLEINFVTRPHPVSLETVRIEPIVPPTSKIESLPAPADLCACGWSDEPHERSEHAPAGALADNAPTPPHATCGRFVSQRGAFATGPDDLCVRRGASGRAHGITRLGPPSQIAETLTQNED